MKIYSFRICLLCFLWMVVNGATAADKTIKMQLSWKHQFQFAGYYTAIEKGFYKAQGLTVELIEGGPGVVCDEKTLLTIAQYCNGPGSVVKKRIDGDAIVALASTIQHSPAVLITLKSSGLLILKDLIGKRVETLVGGAAIPEIKAMFQRQGIDLDKLKNRENSLGVKALINGEVDAKYGFLSNEIYLLDTLGIDYHVIYPSHYGINFYGDALFTSELELSEHPQRVSKFLQASIKGWKYAMANKAEISQLILKKYPTEKTFSALIAEAHVIEELMLLDLIEIGHINKTRWEATAETLVSTGVVRGGYSLDGFVYEQNQSNHTRLLKWLIGFLSLAILVSLVLWMFNRAMSAEIKRRTEAQNKLSQANKLILKQAYTDELTGMGNRRAFYEQAEAELQLAKLDGNSLAALIIDIDHFKIINDRYGHGVGDLALKQLAEIILKIVRANDVQGRVGGEEFAVITTKTDLEGARDLAERMRQAVENFELVLDSITVRMTISIGVAEFSPDLDDINSMLARADNALYRAKHYGRNRVFISPKSSPDSAIIEPNNTGSKNNEHRENLTATL